MPSGRHLLNAWRERSKQNQRTLAATLGVSDGYLSQILSGVRRPKLELLVKIEAISGVPVSSWVDTRRGKSGKSKKDSADSANVCR
jgi:transcriptional regulator with XRE-family HTH domain